MVRYLLFDSGCSLCTEVARRVEEAAGGWLRARSLRDPEMQELLDRAKPGWKWEPALVEVNGDTVQVYQGLRMRLRMMRGLGVKRSWKVVNVLYNVPGTESSVDMERRGFLVQGVKLVAVGALLGLGIKSQPVQAAIAQKGENLPFKHQDIRRSARITGKLAKEIQQKALGSRDIQNILEVNNFRPEEVYVYKHEMRDGNVMWTVSFPGLEGVEKSAILYIWLERPRKWLKSQSLYLIKESEKRLRVVASSVNGQIVKSLDEVRKEHKSLEGKEPLNHCGNCQGPFFFDCYHCASVNWSCALAICGMCAIACGPNLSCLVGCCGGAVYGCCQWGNACCSCFGG